MTTCSVRRSFCLSLAALIALSAAGCGGSAAGKFNKENYDKIKKDSTIAEVEALLGPCTSRQPPEKVSLNTGPALIEKLTWRGDGSREFNAVFIDGKLSAQPIPYDTKLTMANYRKLKRGMTLKECEDLLGPSEIMPFPPMEVTIDGVAYRSVYRKWTIPEHGSFEVTITNDKLKEKSLTIIEYLKKLTAEDDNY